MATFFDGEVTRTWKLLDRAGKEHILSLYHDAMSGVRCAMLDFEEIRFVFLFFLLCCCMFLLHLYMLYYVILCHIV